MENEFKEFTPLEALPAGAKCEAVNEAFKECASPDPWRVQDMECLQLRAIHERKMAVLDKIGEIIKNEWPKENLAKCWTIGIVCRLKGTPYWEERTTVYTDPELEKYMKYKKEN